MRQDAVTGPLREAGIPFVMKPHSEPALTSEAAAQQRGIRLSQVVKCMVASAATGELTVLLIPGDRTLKLRKVRKLTGGGPLALADPGQLVREHQVTIGAISPMHFQGKAAIFMDHTVLQEELVDISSGDLMAGVELASADLRDFLGAEVADIVSVNPKVPSPGTSPRRRSPFELVGSPPAEAPAGSYRGLAVSG
jgi:prolyl-tRNA editing enzyme YbaK/EbsC (Cys-tRNA(Pro) deacylase)